MRVQVFCFSQPYFSWSWKIDPQEVQGTIANWLSRNSGFSVREIKHDTVASFWYPPQLFVSVYYEEPASDKVTRGR